MSRKHKCLMIHTKDHRKFFTYSQNFPNLIEFSKTFNAEISVVKIEDDSKIMLLSELAPAICNASYETPELPYELIEQKLPICLHRAEMLKHAAKTRKYIHKQFLEGRIVSLKDVRKKYGRIGNTELSVSCVCKHIMAVKQELTALGYGFEKVGAGMYRISQSPNLAA